MFDLVIVHSEDPDTEGAVEELLEVARERLGDAVVQGGVVFAGIDHDHGKLLNAICDAFEGIALIGCTTDGEVSSEVGFAEDSIVLLLFVGDSISVGVGLGREVSKDVGAAAKAAVDQASVGLDGAPRLCLTMPEALTCDVAALVRSLRGLLGEDLPVIGGTAGDQWRFQRVLQFCGREVVNDAVPVLLIAGDLIVSHGVASGWTLLGKPAIATAVHGNVLSRVGDMTAIEFYQHYLGPDVYPTGEYPLAVIVGEGDEFYLRAPQGYDLDSGSVIYAGTIPEGARVQLTTGTRDAIIDATKSSVDRAIQGYPGDSPRGALVFSCAARKQLLGTRTPEEYTLLKGSQIGELPFCGFYAYGEVSPVRAGEAPHFHNETFITLLLGTE
ncbi:MAG: FIST N-terminal domain-containing protein [Nannocystaceae bacterium]